MGRTGYLVSGALAFALVAAGILVWTDFFKISLAPEPTAQTMPSLPASDQSGMWTQLMNQITASGGTALTFDDSAIKGWTLPPGHRLERFSLDGGKAVFARLSSTTALNDDFPSWAERGLSFQFQVEMNNISSGKLIEVGVIARSAQSNGSHNLNVVYATQQAGNSGWQKLELSPQFQLLKFTYDVPAVPTGYQSAPIVVLHSDEAGSGRGVELLGIYVKPL